LSNSTSSGRETRQQLFPTSSSREKPDSSQKALFTRKNSPSRDTRVRPTAVWSKASRMSPSSSDSEPGADPGRPRKSLIARRTGPWPSAGRPRRPPELRQGLQEGLGGARAQPLGELLEVVLLGREVDHGLGLDHVARDAVEASEPVGEPELDGPLAGPHQAREDLGRLLEALAAALADRLDELLVDLASICFACSRCAGFSGAKGSRKSLFSPAV